MSQPRYPKMSNSNFSIRLHVKNSKFKLNFLKLSTLLVKYQLITPSLPIITYTK